MGLAVVDTVLKSRCKLASVRDVSFSALGGEDLAPLCVFVCYRNLGLREGDILVSNRQLVFAGRGCTLIAVQESLGPNLGEGMIEETGLAVVPEEGVEGLDVGIDGLLKGGIGRLIGRRVAEELLSAKGVEPVVPSSLGAFRRHFFFFFRNATL